MTGLLDSHPNEVRSKSGLLGFVFPTTQTTSLSTPSCNLLGLMQFGTMLQNHNIALDHNSPLQSTIPSTHHVPHLHSTVLRSALGHTSTASVEYGEVGAFSDASYSTSAPEITPEGDITGNREIVDIKWHHCRIVDEHVPALVPPRTMMDDWTWRMRVVVRNTSR